MLSVFVVVCEEIFFFIQSSTWPGLRVRSELHQVGVGNTRRTEGIKRADKRTMEISDELVSVWNRDSCEETV